MLLECIINLSTLSLSQGKRVCILPSLRTGDSFRWWGRGLGRKEIKED